MYLGFARAGRESSNSFFSTPFVLTACILAVTAVAVPTVSKRLRMNFRKEAIPLRAALRNLDKSRLGRFRFVQANQLSAPIIEALGTAEYIDWVLEDTTYAGSVDPRRIVRLHVTYYTGQPDPVPHTPDVCLPASGYEIVQAENTSLSVPELGESKQIPVRVLTFVRSALYEDAKPVVIYTFHCNGRFSATREGVRLATGNPLDRYAYYSKVEVSYGWDGATPSFPTPEQATAACAELFRRVLPVLVEQHWPDWQNAKSDDAAK